MFSNYKLKRGCRVNMNNQVSKSRRITQKIKVWFGIGDAGFSFMTTVETAYFPAFLTNYALLSNAYVILITSITGAVDIVSSLIAGIVLDKTNFKWGKYRSWLVIGPPAVIILFMLQFSKIGSPSVAAVLICTGFILSHFIWNMSWTANMSLVPILTDDPKERAFLSGRRAAGSNLGKVIASYATLPVVTAIAAFFPKGSSMAFTITAGLFAFIMGITYYIHFIISKGYEDVKVNIKTSGSVVSTDKKRNPSLADMFKAIFLNKPLLIFVLSDFCKLIGYYLLMAAAFYYFKYVTNSISLQPIFLLVFNIAGLLGALFAKNIVARIGTKMSYIVGVSGYIISIVVAYLFAENPVAVIAIMGVGQVLFGISYGLTSSFYSNGATYSQWKTGADTKGVIMAFSSFSIKVSILVRGVILTAGLAVLDFNANMTNVLPEVISGFKIIFFGAPFIFGLVALIAILFYNLPDGKVKEMENEIAAR